MVILRWVEYIVLFILIGVGIGVVLICVGVGEDLVVGGELVDLVGEGFLVVEVLVLGFVVVLVMFCVWLFFVFCIVMIFDRDLVVIRWWWIGMFLFYRLGISK